MGSCTTTHRKWVRGETIGRGSTSTVSLAYDPSTTFAVKSSALSSSAILQREVRFLSSVSSSHVVSYFGHDVTVENGLSYYNIFIEYAPGGSLADEILRTGGGLEEWRIRYFTRGILMGLAYLHSVGISHGDIKGKNVLIGSDGQANIADLGCARWVDDDHLPSVCGGTPVFMAPEVARGEDQHTEADVWGLGCTVLEMATGMLPWAEEKDVNPITILRKIGYSDDLPRFPTGLSDEGVDFLGKCLRRNKSERFTADELLRHPFISEISLMKINPTWTSPKCILDQDIWNSMEDDEMTRTTETSPPDFSSVRIRELCGGNCNISSNDDEDDSDDGSWILVRQNSSISTNVND